MSAFPKIPQVVLLHSVGCCCSPPATAPLPDGSCSSRTEVERWVLPWGFGDTSNAERFQCIPLPLPALRKGSQREWAQPSPSPWQICTFSTAWSTFWPHTFPSRGSSTSRGKSCPNTFPNKHPWTILLPQAPCSHPSLVLTFTGILLQPILLLWVALPQFHPMYCSQSLFFVPGAL